MLRIARLTDYAIVLMVHIGKNGESTLNAAEISKSTNISGPTVSKLLKKLAKSNLLDSSRGVTGGYKLSASPNQISVADIIAAIEGPLGLTVCSLKEDLCEISDQCDMKAPWIKINEVVVDTLKNYKLSDLIGTNKNTQKTSDINHCPVEKLRDTK